MNGTVHQHYIIFGEVILLWEEGLAILEPLDIHTGIKNEISGWQMSGARCLPAGVGSLGRAR